MLQYMQQVFHQWWSTGDRCMCILVLYRVNVLGCSGLVSWYRWWVFQYWSTVDRSMCALALSHLNMWCVAVGWCHSTCGRSFTSGGSLNRSTCMLAQYHVNVGCCVAGVWCHSTCGRSSSSCSRGCRVPRPPSTSKASVLSCLVCSWSDLQCWLVDHFHVGLWLFPGCQSCRLVLAMLTS